MFRVAKLADPEDAWLNEDLGGKVYVFLWSALSRQVLSVSGKLRHHGWVTEAWI